MRSQESDGLLLIQGDRFRVLGWIRVGAAPDSDHSQGSEDHSSVPAPGHTHSSPPPLHRLRDCVGGGSGSHAYIQVTVKASAHTQVLHVPVKILKINITYSFHLKYKNLILE